MKKLFILLMISNFASISVLKQCETHQEYDLCWLEELKDGTYGTNFGNE
jgi:hypothetical protein